MTHFKPIYIIDGCRTPIGRPQKSLKEFTAAQLAAVVLKAVVKRNKIATRNISEIFLGNVVSAGCGQNIARQATVLAGLPKMIPAMTVDNVCGAGLQAVILAARTIKAGESDLCLAGGTESATHCPGLISSDEEEIGWEESLLRDGLTCGLTGKKMGEFVEELSKKNKISRKAQDRFTLTSHQKACSAGDNGCFDKEMIGIKNQKGKLLKRDDQPRSYLTLDLLKEFDPSFKKGGTLTAANSSSPADGAAVVALASSKGLKYCSKKPLAKVIGYVSIAADPKQTFQSGIQAVKQALTLSRSSVKSIGLFEVCESFAAQALLYKEKLRIPEHKMNVFGGDVALGHPLGSAGTRILVTLLHALHSRKQKRGLACIAYGGGGAMAMVLERLT